MRARVVLAGLAAALAACSEAGTPLATLPSDAPRLSLRAGRVSVAQYSAYVSNGDWRPAIEKAMTDAGTVVFPAGATYTLKSTVSVLDGTRFVGEGATSVISVDGAVRAAFVGVGSAADFKEDVTVDSLAFAGTGAQQQVALSIVNGRRIKFRWNNLTKIGLIETDVADRATATKSTLTSDVEVTGNHGDGMRQLFPPASPALWGVYFNYTDSTTVSDNTLHNYLIGIQWWGGDAKHERIPNAQNPEGKNMPHGLPTFAEDMTITGNTVTNTEAGIWGSMGRNIKVSKNRVEVCVDVCLDAEGGSNIHFQENRAYNAGQTVLGVYDYAKDILFDWNEVIQDGRYWPEYGAWPAHYGETLFASYNVEQRPEQISIRLQNNWFHYTGGSGVGRIWKSASDYFLLANSGAMNKVVVDMLGNNNGYVEITGNPIDLGNRSTGSLPAIAVGRNHNESAWIGGNTITSTVAQSAPAIYAYQDQWYTTLTTNLDRNTITGFSNAVKVEAHNSSHTFGIYNTTTTGGFQKVGTAVAVGSGNPWPL
ncbi:MAG: right-handed parallel beta-helix repeat-containing protein [Gemmatimonadota bacterium]